MRLTDSQRQAVEVSGHSLISACPGAGKTRVLSSRAAHLLNTNQENRVVTVTFTRDSAQELEGRIKKQTNKTRGRLLAGTFHALCLRQIRGNIMRGYRLISAGEQSSIVRRAISRAKLDGVLSYEDAVEAISTYKSSINPKVKPDEAGEIFRSYQHILDREHMIDFSDIVILAVMGMKNGKVAPIPATHMLVDEAQDMDQVQYAWIKCHSDNGTETLLVGDDDQSIYGWRHALGYEGLMQFKAEHKAKHITLAHNFRSEQAIIHHAGLLIQNNKNRVQKDFVCTSDKKGIIEVVRHSNEENQAKSIAALAEDKEEWAVLGRTNKALDLVELAFLAAKLPYTRIGGSSLWDRDVAAVYLAFLESLEDNHAGGIGTVLHWAGINDMTIASIDPKATLEEGLKTVYSKLEDDPGSKPAARFVSKLIAMIPQWLSLLKNGRTSLVCGGVAVCLEEQVKGNKRMLLNRASSVIAALSGTLKQRMAFVRNSGKKNENKPIEANVPKTILMTMHASKGLEFDCVSVVSCVEGFSPHLDSPLDEERRLMYVAMTRARHRLVLHVPLVDSDNAAYTISRFIKEAGL